MKTRKSMPMIKETVIELEDHGQDFTRFYVDGNDYVIDARRSQTSTAPEGRVWKGQRVENKVIRKGTLLRLIKDGKETVIKYPVIKVTRRSIIAG
jgi:hypothetical protein